MEYNKIERSRKIVLIHFLLLLRLLTENAVQPLSCAMLKSFRACCRNGKHGKSKISEVMLELKYVCCYHGGVRGMNVLVKVKHFIYLNYMKHSFKEL